MAKKNGINNNGSKSQIKNPMIQLIEMGEDGIHATSHPLAKIWRIILYKSFIRGDTWYRLISTYQERYHLLQSSKLGCNIKGNFTRELAKDRITWPNLMRGMEIMQFDEVEVNFICRKKGKPDIEVPMKIRFDQKELLEGNLEEFIEIDE